MTPEHLTQLFDGSAVLIMIVWGILCKYVPVAAKIPNMSIGWVNFIGYVLAKLAVPAAHAGVLDQVPNAVGTLISGATNAGWAMILYETFGRSLLEHVFKLKKAVPAS